MLRKIDCVMVRVDDLEATARYYREVLGLRQLWQDKSSVGMGMPDTDAEIVLHIDPNIPQNAVHYLVEDVVNAVAELRQKGCVVRIEPFDIKIGKCAVLNDPFGNPLYILDITKGPRTQQ